MQTQPREEAPPVSFAEFAKRLMERDPPEACSMLPMEERALPMDPVSWGGTRSPVLDRGAHSFPQKSVSDCALLAAMYTTL